MAEKETCPTCGKVTYSFLHSCPGVAAESWSPVPCIECGLTEAMHSGNSDGHPYRTYSVVPFPTHDERCAECGGLATRQCATPGEESIRGCESCFPHWPRIQVS